MKLGLLIGELGARVDLKMDLIKHVDALGFESAWTVEAWGADAVSPAAWILAQTSRLKVGTSIMQMQTRTPALAATTAMTLNALSQGRFIPGIGASGPLVIEGWHGVAFGKPVTGLREYAQIMRQVFAREAPLNFDGEIYQVPYQGPGATGLGKALKTILQSAAEIPIFSANITPRGIEAAAEVCNGFLPIWMDPEKFSVFEAALNAGFARAAGKEMAQFEVSPFVKVIMGNDVDECMKPIRANMALYIGGMGSRDRNFYKDYAIALGYEEDAERIQQLYLAGEREQAAAAVPEELIDACHLVGPAARISERLQRWRVAADKGHVSRMILDCRQPEALEYIAGEML
jgi:F420-dependent oxidoreductase-like protein